MNNIDLEENYLNRELSWIKFNQRVLLTGMEKEYKPLDKIKFCSIFSNNLDEFFMVRVASIKAQVEADINKKTIDGMTPLEQLNHINQKVKTLTTLQENHVNQLINNDLKAHGIFIKKYKVFRSFKDAFMTGGIESQKYGKIIQECFISKEKDFFKSMEKNLFASTISSILFISVAESIEIFFPIFHFGCFNA